MFIWILFFLIVFSILYFVFFSFDNKNQIDRKNYFNRRKKYLSKEYITKKGEIVKSYGEKRIADYLYWKGVIYEYEHPYTRKDGGVNRPDFYLPEYDIYIEYYGMIEDANYRYNMHLKHETFEDEHMRVISIYPKHITNKTLGIGINAGLKKFIGHGLDYNY